MRNDTIPETSIADFISTRGWRHYELSNHLGNVQATVADYIQGDDDNNPEVEVYSSQDYYAFGMVMPGRSYTFTGNSSLNRYRFAWNGAEVMDEIYGRFGTYDLGARMYNPKIGRMFSPDPKEAEYAWQSTYAYYANSPIATIDENGEGVESGESNSSEDNKPSNGIVNRFTSLGRAGLGVLQMTGGALLALTPEPTFLTKVGAVVAWTHGADDLQAGVRGAFTGKSVESFTYQGLSSTAKVLGANDNTAHTIATTGDMAAGFPGGTGVYRGIIAPFKIVGTAQQTGTAGHAATSYYWAFRYALNPKVEKVTLDLGYKKLGAVGIVPYKYGPRPDVGVLYKGGAVKAIEVQSKTDIPARLIYRNANFQNLKGITGSVDVKDPLKIFQILNLK